MLLQLLLMDQRTGSNDIGVYAFLINSQVSGKVLTDYTNCVYSALDAIYASGGWYFELLSIAPLYLSPLYANYTIHGLSFSSSGRRAFETSPVWRSACRWGWHDVLLFI